MARPMTYPHPASLRLNDAQKRTLDGLVQMLRDREIEADPTESHAFRWLLDQESVRRLAGTA